ncbi:hypothetical protein AKO1_006712 [Acrasis kona]
MENSISYRLTNESIYLTSYDISNVNPSINIVSASLYITSQDIEEMKREGATEEESLTAQDSTISILLSAPFERSMSLTKISSGLSFISQHVIRKGETIAVDITDSIIYLQRSNSQDISLGFRIVGTTMTSFASRDYDARSSYIQIKCLNV